MELCGVFMKCNVNVNTIRLTFIICRMSQSEFHSACSCFASSFLQTSSSTCLLSLTRYVFMYPTQRSNNAMTAKMTNDQFEVKCTEVTYKFIQLKLCSHPAVGTGRCAAATDCTAKSTNSLSALTLLPPFRPNCTTTFYNLQFPHLKLMSSVVISNLRTSLQLDWLSYFSSKSAFIMLVWLFKNRCMFLTGTLPTFSIIQKSLSSVLAF